jgi:hypothetical protein
MRLEAECPHRRPARYGPVVKFQMTVPIDSVVNTRTADEPVARLR